MLKTILLTLLLIVSLSIGYYYVIIWPEKDFQEQVRKEEDRTKQERLKQEQEAERKEKERLENLQRKYQEERRVYIEREERWQKEGDQEAQRKAEKLKQEALETQEEAEKLKQEALETQKKAEREAERIKQRAMKEKQERQQEVRRQVRVQSFDQIAWGGDTRYGWIEKKCYKYCDEISDDVDRYLRAGWQVVSSRRITATKNPFSVMQYTGYCRCIGTEYILQEGIRY